MSKYFKDEDGQVFMLKDGKGYYTCRVVQRAPTRRTNASPKEIEAYHLVRELTWKSVLKNMGLCFAVARRLGLGEEAVYDCGISALARAVQGYDVTRGVKFSTYAYTAIYREMRAWAGQQCYEPSIPDGWDVPVEDSTKHEDHEVLQYILKSLCEYDRTLLVLHYLKGFTYEELGKLTGVTKGTVHAHLKKALRRAQEHGRLAT
jgi:RNA polymerase sigma factor (sigma-70 family)